MDLAYRQHSYQVATVILTVSLYDRLKGRGDVRPERLQETGSLICCGWQVFCVLRQSVEELQLDA